MMVLRPVPAIVFEIRPVYNLEYEIARREHEPTDVVQVFATDYSAVPTLSVQTGRSAGSATR